MGAILAYENYSQFPGASINASTEAPGLGIGSVLTPQIADIWRSAAWGSGNTVTVSSDLGVARTGIRIFIVAAPPDSHLPASAAQVRIVASTVTMGATDVMDTGLLPLVMSLSGLWVYLAPAPITARYVEFQFVGGAGDTYLQLGRVWVGPALVTAVGPPAGPQHGYADTAANDRTALSGVRYSTPGSVWPQVSFQLNELTAAEQQWIKQMSFRTGSGGQAFASPRETSPAENGALGRLSVLPGPIRRSYNAWSAAISIDGDL